MHPEKNGVPFVEGCMSGDEMIPYKIWESDMWKCSCCGVSVLIGFGRNAHAFNHEERFDTVLEEIRKDPWVVIERGINGDNKKEGKGNGLQGR